MKTLRRSIPGFLDRFWNRSAARPRQPRRWLAMEPLESRHLLSVTLAPIGDQSVLAGAPLNLALTGTSSAGNPLDYTVEVSNPQLSADIPTGNPSLRIDVEGAGIDGSMVLELFEDLVPETVGQIVTLAEDNFYDGLIFHRVIDGFMIQGGCPNGDGSGGPGFQFDDEFHPALQFTGPGLLAMANSGRDTNGSQFFITAGPTRWLDFRHTIFGLLTEGDDVRQQINDAAPEEGVRPVDDVVMTQVTVFDDDQNGVLRLSAPLDALGSSVVTVRATDRVTGEWASETFEVSINWDPMDSPPFLGKIDPIVTTVDTPVDFQIPAIGTPDNGLYFTGSVKPYHPNVTLWVHYGTGEATLTPTGGAVGVFSVELGVDSWSFEGADTQMVPVYIGPAAPAAVGLLPESDTGASDSDGVTNLNNSAGATLRFQVDGVLPGTDIELLADGVVIGRATAAGDSVVVTTDGTTVLADGTYQITARQTLKDQAVDVGNLQTTVDLPGALSAPLTLAVDTTPPQFTSAPVTTALEQSTYSYRVTSEDATGVEYELIEGPAGMTIDSATGLITWPSVPEEGTRAEVIVRATDLAGNAARQEFTIEVVAPTSSISGFVYLDSSNAGQRIIISTGQEHLGISSATIQLFRVTSDDTTLWGEVETDEHGYYHFADLPAGTYMLEQVQPANYLDGKDTLGTVGGETRGTVVGTNQFRIELSANEHGTDYNFGERGLRPEAFSLRLLLASSPYGRTAPPAESAPAAAALSAAATAESDVVPAAAGLLAITELNYNPYLPTPDELAAGFNDAQSFEFIELQNVGQERIDLTGVEFTAGVRFDFSDAAITTLSPGDYVLVVQNWAALQFRYGPELPVAGQYEGQLENAGERVTLRDRSGAVIHDFWYRQYGSWPEAAHGQGSTLEAIDLTGNYDDLANWRASVEYGGSPGREGLGAFDLAFAQDHDWLEW